MTMHYLTYVFIEKNAHITEAVKAALRPFGDGFEVAPWRRYLDAGEVAAMARNYGLLMRSTRQIAAQMEDWNGGEGGMDEKGIYATLTYNPDAKWDWYEIGGRWDGFLTNNAATAHSLLRSPKLKDFLPHDFLTPDGKWHEKATFVSTGWLQGHMVHTPEGRWLQQFKQALAAWPHHRVACVDRHL